MNVRIACWLALLMVAAPAHAQSQPVPQDVDLPAVLRLAQERSPRVALQAQEIAAAQAERLTAAAWPNPTVSFGRDRPDHARTLFDGRRQQEVAMEIPLLLGGQHGARVEAAERGVAAARARVAKAGSDLAAEAGQVFVGLLVAQEKHAVLEAGMGELQHMREAVAGRRAAGMASDYDLLRIDVERTQWRTQLAEARIEQIERQAELAALLGLAQWQPRAIGPLRALDAASSPPAPDQAPALTVAREAEAAARAGVEAARRERFPEVSLKLGRTWTDRPFGAANTVGVAVEIPIFDTRRGAEDRARAEARAALLQRELAEVETATELHRLEVQVAQRRATLDEFQQTVGARLTTLAQMADDAYRFGRTSIIDLLDATRARQEVQLKQLELTGALVEAQLRLKAVRGEFAGVGEH